VSDHQIRFAVLGPVRARSAGTELDLGPPQQRAALAVLLLRPDRPVPLTELVDVLWGDHPPATAVNVLHRYIGRLRRVFEPDLPIRATGRFLVRSAGGYRLQITAENSDLLRFQELARQARTEVMAGRSAASLPLFTAALEEWQGPGASGLDPEVRSHALFIALEQQRADTVQALADAELDVAARQRALDPLQQARPIGARPAQLPADLGSFAGRDAEMSQAMTLLGDPTRPPPTVLIATINGMAGVGKTTFALHWAHRAAEQFPDGQLYVNLRGFDPTGPPLDPATVLRGFLDALGVAPAHFDFGRPAAARLSWQQALTILADLDHAEADQVRDQLRHLDRAQVDRTDTQDTQDTRATVPT
jgi:hypothetical protein